MWLAAVIDCEGWVGMYESTRKNGQKVYTVGIGVGNTKKELINKLRSLTGMGKIYYIQLPAPAKHKWTWMITRRLEFKRILKTIRPYLLLKQRQADLLLKLPPLQDKEPLLRARLCAKLRLLNRKGVH